MKIVCISDTHNLHRHYGRHPFGEIPTADAIIHAGDVTTHGTLDELNQFLTWFSNLPHPIKIFIAGNHDRILESDVTFAIPKHITYLKNSATTLPNGLKVWGSPYTPKHQDFAFQLSTHEFADNLWNSIPEDTDILITHGPPLGILDGNSHIGCSMLLDKCNKIKPRYHIFGHDHASYGWLHLNQTTFINASVHTWLWKQTQRMEPPVITLP